MLLAVYDRWPFCYLGFLYGRLIDRSTAEVAGRTLERGGEVKRITVCLVSVLTLAIPVSLGSVLESGQPSSGSAIEAAARMDLGWG